MEIQDLAGAALREAGIQAYGFVGRGTLREACSHLPPSLGTRIGVDAAGGAIAVALAYGEGLGEDEKVAPWAAHPGPIARLARFARAHWYAELCSRLKDAAARIRLGLEESGAAPGPASEWRYFSNSRLPERRLALEAGLGKLGRNGLLMLPGPGSSVVLGVLLLPQWLSPSIEPSRGRGHPTELLDPSCSNCRACATACPTSALGVGEGFVRELCIQHWSSIPGPLPAAIEAAWGDRLYGCDACQEACPRFKPDASARAARGLLGPGLPARWLGSASDGEIREALRGSALGMKWIALEALRRNASLVLRGARQKQRGGI